ncbi:MAG: ComEC/Rec2 family competence protein [Clostridia bacterium]
MKKYRILALLLILALCMGFIACSSPEAAGALVNAGDGHSLKVHFIDVGQADAILIQGLEGENIVIDAGNNNDSEAVVKYIKNQGVKELKAVIGTHPHEDHIGGLDAVIKSFKVDKVYLPKAVHTSDTFRDVLNAVSDKGIKVTTAVKGVSILLSGMTAEFIGPVGSEYDNLNNHSAVLRLTYGETSFLFQGDAEEESEQDILESDMSGKLKTDVLKVGHHGSSSSTTPEYLAKVNPKYAVIMVGKGNDYGHPHKETMGLLKSKGIGIYRTDEQGTIVAESDGKSIKFNVNSVSYNNGTENTDSLKLYTDSEGNGLIKGNINSKGEKIYHLPGGAYYNKTVPEKWFKTEQEAQEAGFRPSSK